MNKKTLRPILLTILLPGSGHLLQRQYRTGLFFLMLILVEATTTLLATQKGLLWWVCCSDGKLVLPSAILYMLYVLTWGGAFLSLFRNSRQMERTSRGYWEHAREKLASDSKGITGGAIIGAVVMIALFAPFYVIHDPIAMDFAHALEGPSILHPLGTDDYGRDLMSRIFFGSRVALGIGAGATLLNMVWGGLLGIIAGYYKNVIDSVIMRFLEVIGSIPYLILVIFIVGIFGSSIEMLIITLGIFGLAPARIIRSKVLSVRESDYVTAAKASGARNLYTIVRHIIPNSMAPLLVVTTMQIGINIIIVAGLSFLGFGVRPPTPSWGSMLQEAQQFIVSNPWLGLPPGIAIMLTVLGFNLLGDSLRDALDPSLGMRY